MSFQYLYPPLEIFQAKYVLEKGKRNPFVNTFNFSEEQKTELRSIRKMILIENLLIGKDQLFRFFH